MKIEIYLFLVFLLWTSCASTQTIDKRAMDDVQEEILPYRQIPDAPDKYTAETVTARMIDGLGYRYYWATEKLRTADLDYRISVDARTTQETLEHILGLSQAILNGVLVQPNIRPQEERPMTWEEQRMTTLNNLKQASDTLRSASMGDIYNYKIIYHRGEKTAEFPFWNMINGQIADALWHTGQVVSFRRAAGNPIPPGVNVFTGKTFE